MPRSRSSGALSIESNERNVFFGLCFCNTFVIAAVSVVFPWSMCPIVPTFTCGFERSNFSFAIASSLGPFRELSLFPGPLADPQSQNRLLALAASDDLVRHAAGRFFIPREVHRVVGAALGGRAHVRRVAEHLAQRHIRLDDL